MASTKHNPKSKTASKTLLNIIHFNDVYNITEGRDDKCCGGAARFKTIMDTLKELKPEPLIFFSGDFLNPSQLSTITNGEHMIPVMNSFGITCSMIGNHDLDFGNEHCIKCLSKLNYPTLNTNIFTPKQADTVIDADGHDDADESLLEPLGQCRKELVIEHNGLKIGLIGVSEDWCNTIPVKPAHGIVYKDFKTQCTKYIAKLRAEHELDLVIVLTHSRKENDLELADSVEGIDLILGGHDHLYHVALNEKHKSVLVKSGCDFQGITLIRVTTKEGDDRLKGDDLKVLGDLNTNCLIEAKQGLDGLHHRISTFHYIINRTLKAEPKMARLVDSLSAEFMKQISKPIGYVHCDLDTRFVRIRRRESAACSLVCDIVRNAYRVDAVILCGGGIRSDKVHRRGVLTHKDILDMVPFQDPVIVKRVKGSCIVAAIKHSILNLPKLDGRFAHVSGLKYVFDSRKSPKDRLQSVVLNRYGDEEKGDCKWMDIDDDAYYTVASREYTMNGGDGFEMLNDPDNEIVVDDESGQALSVVLRNFFWAVSAVNDAATLLDSGGKELDDNFVNDVTALMETLAIDSKDDDGDAASDGSGSSKGSSHGVSDKENVNVNVDDAESAEMKVPDHADGGKEAVVKRPESVQPMDPDSMFLKIAPRIEQRIIDVAKAGLKGQEQAVGPDEIVAFTPSNWRHLPPWLHMKERPVGREAVSEFVRPIQLID